MNDAAVKKLISAICDEMKTRHGSEFEDAFHFAIATGMPARLHVKWDNEDKEMKIECLDKIPTEIRVAEGGEK